MRPSFWPEEWQDQKWEGKSLTLEPKDWKLTEEELFKVFALIYINHQSNTPVTPSVIKVLQVPKPKHRKYDVTRELLRSKDLIFFDKGRWAPLPKANEEEIEIFNQILGNKEFKTNSKSASPLDQIADFKEHNKNKSSTHKVTMAKSQLDALTSTVEGLFERADYEARKSRHLEQENSKLVLENKTLRKHNEYLRKQLEITKYTKNPLKSTFKKRG